MPGGPVATAPAHQQSAVLAVTEDRQAIGRILARLGQSRVKASLEELANAARIGVLVLEPEVIAKLDAACQEIRAMRLDLMRALGLREDRDE